MAQAMIFVTREKFPKKVSGLELEPLRAPLKRLTTLPQSGVISSMAYILRVLSLTVLVAVWATSVSSMGLSLTKAEAVAAPGFIDGCHNCSKGGTLW